MILVECLLNRLRGTGIIKYLGTLKIFNINIKINFNGNHIYGLYLATLLGFLTMNPWLGLAILVAYLIGEAKGWGEWIGSLTRHEPWDEEMLQRNYRDEEGKTFPFIHQIANSVCKEQIDGSFEDRAKQYRKYATVALMLRGMYWWLPVYGVIAAFGVISWYVAVIAGVGLGLMFPLACELGKRLKFERVYDLKFVKLSFSRGWENQEIVYGAMQGVCLWYVIIGVVYG
jgi:hypothetical protein